jgi:hypothetical protein
VKPRLLDKVTALAEPHAAAETLSIALCHSLLSNFLNPKYCQPLLAILFHLASYLSVDLIILYIRNTRNGPNLAKSSHFSYFFVTLVIPSHGTPHIPLVYFPL